MHEVLWGVIELADGLAVLVSPGPRWRLSGALIELRLELSIPGDLKRWLQGLSMVGTSFSREMLCSR